MKTPKYHLWISLFFTLIFYQHTLMGYSQQKTSTEKPLSIKTQTIKHQQITPELTTFGTIAALNKIQLIAEVSEKVIDSNHQLIPGASFEKGTPIIQFNDTSTRYALYAKKSTFIKSLTQLISDYRIEFPSKVTQWETYLKNYNIEKPLEPLPRTNSPKERYYLSAKNIYEQYYSIQKDETILSKHTIIAPFNGTLSQPQVRNQSRVSSGQTLGTFIQKGTYALTISVPASQRNLISTGNPIIITHTSLQSPIKASIQSIDTHVNPNTQMIQIYTEFESSDLNDGDLVTCLIKGTPITNASLIPRQYITNNHITIKSNNNISTIPISIIHIQGNDAIIKNIPKKSDLVLRSPIQPNQ